MQSASASSGCEGDSHKSIRTRCRKMFCCLKYQQNFSLSFAFLRVAQWRSRKILSLCTSKMQIFRFGKRVLTTKEISMKRYRAPALDRPMWSVIGFNWKSIWEVTAAARPIYGSAECHRLGLTCKRSFSFVFMVFCVGFTNIPPVFNLSHFKAR